MRLASVVGFFAAPERRPAVLGAAAALGGTIFVLPDAAAAAAALVAGLAFAAALPAHAFLAGCLLVAGVFQLSFEHPFQSGSVNVYSVDLLVPLVVLRALLPLERRPALVQFARSERGTFLVWLALMAVAGVIGLTKEASLDTVFRLGSAGLYLPLMYLSFSRIVRESSFRLESFLSGSAAVVLALIAFMVAMRVAGHPFEPDSTIGLARVETSSGDELRRDYGFSSAFILYPVLALTAMAILLSTAGPRWRLLLIALAGISATFATLIRSEIFGLALGAAMLIVFPAVSVSARARLRTAVLMVGGLAIVALGLFVISPSLVQGVVERSLPGILPQSELAEDTADFRAKVIDEAVAAAGQNPFGVGFVPEGQLPRPVAHNYEQGHPPGAEIFTDGTIVDDFVPVNRAFGDGAKSLYTRIDAPASFALTYPKGDGGSPTIPIISNIEYRVGAWVRLQSKFPGTAPRIGIYWTTAAGEKVSRSMQPVAKGSNTYSAVVTAPEGAERGALSIEQLNRGKLARGSLEFYVDDFTLKAIPEAFGPLSGVPPGYASHSSPAWFLIHGGWPLLVASVAAWIALVASSFRVRARPEPAWLQPAFVSIIAMLTLYAFGASLVDQAWVVVLIALVCAVRFNATPAEVADRP